MFSQFHAPTWDQLLILLLVASRIGGLVLTAPIFGSRAAPFQTRGIIWMGLSALIAVMLWNSEVATVPNSTHIVLLVIREAIIGLSLGLAVLLLISSMQFAGALIGQMGGMQLAEVSDATTGNSVPLFGQLMNLVALAVFFTIGGHRQVMDALLETFRTIPLGTGDHSALLLASLSEMTAMSFRMALRASAPIMISLLMTTLILGLLSRAVPQLNVLAVGLSANSMVILLTLTLSIGSAAWLFEQSVNDVLTLIRNTLLASPS